MPTITVYLPQPLYKKLKQQKNINKSKIVAGAFEKELAEPKPTEKKL